MWLDAPLKEVFSDVDDTLFAILQLSCVGWMSYLLTWLTLNSL